VLVGLAPAAHGANRTGRLFTGDVPGGSSDFLMQALHACGLASLPSSRSADDGLTLTDVWISAAVRCAPPGNTPLPVEVARCLPFLDAELRALPKARVVLALGRLAFDVVQRLRPAAGAGQTRRRAFEHEGVYRTTDGLDVVASYHPSRQNTQTGRLTQAMLRRAIRRAQALAG
jgi:uracil-DNA glycosylase family 4